MNTKKWAAVLVAALISGQALATNWVLYNSGSRGKSWYDSDTISKSTNGQNVPYASSWFYYKLTPAQAVHGYTADELQEYNYVTCSGTLLFAQGAQKASLKNKPVANIVDSAPKFKTPKTAVERTNAQNMRRVLCN